MAQANEVIDFYLNGPGSFTPDGPRKPPVDEPGFDSTIRDLNGFKESVTNAKQFADDPNHILDSVIDLVKKTVGQIQNTVRDQATTGPDVKDNISRRPLPIIDPLNNARVPAPDPEPYISQDPGNAFPRRVLPITLQAANPLQTAGPSSLPFPLAQEVTPSTRGFIFPGANAPTSLFSRSPFSRLLSAGPDSPLAADDKASPPLQPDATQGVADNGPTRFLVRRTVDPPQGSPFATRPAPSQPSPDGSLSLDDAYLEYLKRLNAAE